MSSKRNQPRSFNAEAHQNYMKAVETDMNTPACIVGGELYRIVKGELVSQEEFMASNPIPVVHSFLFGKHQADGRLNYLQP